MSMYFCISGRLLFDSAEKAKQSYDKLIEKENSVYCYFSDQLYLDDRKLMFMYYGNFISYSVYENTKDLINEVTLKAERGKITVRGGDDANTYWEYYYVSPAILRKQNKKFLEK